MVFRRVRAAAVTAFAVACFVISSVGRADEGGVGADGKPNTPSNDATAAAPRADGDGEASDGSEGDGFVVGCDGDLCETLGPAPAVPGTCAVSPRAPGSAPAPFAAILLTLVAFAAVSWRRKRPGTPRLSRPTSHTLKRPARSYRFGVWIALFVATHARDAWAQGVPAPTELPSTLSLDEALSVFRERGLDLLIAEAAVRSAEGATQIAGAVPNPVVGASWGYAFTYQKNDPAGSCVSNNTRCSNQVWTANASDSAAIEDSLAGKRDLRLKVARNALAAAKMSRVDAERTLVFQVKSAYAQVAQAVLGQRFAKEVAETNAKMLEVFETRYRNGAINEGDLARVRTTKLESDQAFDTAVQNLRQSRAALAFLLGVRGVILDFDVDTKVLDFAVPALLANSSDDQLLRMAFDHRPDLIALGYQKASSAAQVELTKRQQFPDIALSLTYAQGGYGGLGTNAPLQSPMVTVGASAPLPVFYQLQGETREARAQDDSNALQQAKATAQVVNDLWTAYAAFVGGRRLVERMESGGLLQSARAARDITRIQYDKGAATLTDYLAAQQDYISTNEEYIGDLSNYWTAVFQVEQAVGLAVR